MESDLKNNNPLWDILWLVLGCVLSLVAFAWWLHMLSL